MLALGCSVKTQLVDLGNHSYPSMGLPVSRCGAGMGLDKYAGRQASAGRGAARPEGREAPHGSNSATESWTEAVAGCCPPFLLHTPFSRAPRKTQDVNLHLCSIGQAPAGLELGWRWQLRGHVPRSWLSHGHELWAPLPCQCCFPSEAGFLSSHVLWFGALPVRDGDCRAVWEQSRSCAGRAALCEGPSPPSPLQLPHLEGQTPVPRTARQHP